MKGRWESCNLGDVCGFVRGPFGGSLKKSIFVQKGFAVYEQQHAINNQFEHVRYFVNETKFDEMKRFELFPGELIMSCSGTMGKIAIVPAGIKRGIINQALLKLSPSKVLGVDFLAHWMASPNFQQQLEAETTGVAIKNVASVRILKDIKISLPPLPEQKRIVAILDEAFEGIDAAIANTQKNLANARELFESYLNSVFTEKGEGWKSGALSEIGADIKTGPFGSLLHKSDYIENGTPLINPAHIINGQIVPDARKTVNDGALNRLNAYRVKLNDVIIGRRGDMGRSAPITEKEEGWLCGTGCFVMTPKVGNSAQFISLLLGSKFYKDKITKLASGATMLNLSNKALGSLSVSLPSHDQQLVILDQVNKVTADQHKLENVYTKKHVALLELKQSLLQKAFSGELTAKPDDLPSEAVA